MLWFSGSFPIFLGHSDDGFDSGGTDCHLPRGDCHAMGLVESFDLQGIRQASYFL